ncbi:DEAD/DEAH box helicase [Photobacterium aphoticum]|uniref:DEAD-box ATP-dependent RNA helicase RhpA n=1 Tax=Photobacterium aphoticum TaxID=754436 RepID=A0A0J1GQ76_9GAMM|nr:DEAD/DEAH box helicase [Photobacterium aphoticum]KLV01915.1 hypothetical protein ABT58_05775 [Photobacterium aphoticum]PSU60150.1 DEAD/DEAH box helicase [Photobacterium aphoticum]GHA33540.1 RNA helicase [Photobacterium aphoticum]
MPFSTLGLSDPILKAIAELGYQSPTPIQEKAIPVALTGKNLIAAAQTGTGKTASFTLPILEMLSKGETQRKKRVRALVLVPTRELAVQVADNVEQYSKYIGLTSLAVYGGVDDKPQRQRLIEGVDILVATPGRLLDLHSQKAVYFEEIEVLVLDEADRMLDMGFIEKINDIVERLPLDRQNMLFSATLSRQVRELAKTAVHNPVEISVTKDDSAKPNIDQWLTTVDKDKKSALLSHLINENQWDQALIFIETKHGAAKLVSQLEKRGIVAEAIHSGRSQDARAKVLDDFKKGTLKYLVATGVAARGIDIDELSRVINYDLPFPADEYVHRIGRTGRAGASGEAISLVSKDDFKNLCMIESRLGHLIVRKEIEGFAPKKPVPVSILNYVPKNRRPENQDRPARNNRNDNARSEHRGEKKRTEGQAENRRPARRKKPASRNGNGAQNRPVKAQSDK